MALQKFSSSLLQTLVIEEPKVVSEFHNLIDALAKLATKPGYPESLQQLIEMIKNPVALSASNTGNEDTSRQSRDNKGPSLLVASREELNIVDSAKPDPTGLREQGMTNKHLKVTFSYCLEGREVKA